MLCCTVSLQSKAHKTKVHTGHLVAQSAVRRVVSALFLPWQPDSMDEGGVEYHHLTWWLHPNYGQFRIPYKY